MEARLAPVNAVLGLCTRHDVNPAPLAEHGFRVAALEVPVVSTEGRVTVDVVLHHEETGLLLACEAKSGANVELAQARGYAALDAATLVQAASVTVRRRSELEVAVLYICLADNLGRIRNGLRRAGLTCGVLAVAEHEISLDAAEHAPDPVRAAMARPCRLAAPVTARIAFDHESSLDAVVAPVQAELVAAASHREQIVSVRSLAERACPQYPIYGAAAKGRIRAKVDAAVRQVVDRDPTGTFRYEGTTGTRDEPNVRIVKTPEDADTRGRTQQYQALGRSRHTATRRRPETEGQLDLLEELAGADEDDETVDEANGPDRMGGGGDDEPREHR